MESLEERGRGVHSVMHYAEPRFVLSPGRQNSFLSCCHPATRLRGDSPLFVMQVCDVKCLVRPSATTKGRCVFMQISIYRSSLV